MVPVIKDRCWLPALRRMTHGVFSRPPQQQVRLSHLLLPLNIFREWKGNSTQHLLTSYVTQLPFTGEGRLSKITLKALTMARA